MARTPTHKPFILSELKRFLSEHLDHQYSVSPSSSVLCLVLIVNINKIVNSERNPDTGEMHPGFCLRRRTREGQEVL